MFRFFHDRPLLLAVVLGLASLLGLIGYHKLPRNMFPDMERPQVTVITQLPGAAAMSVAQKVSRPIEQELYTLSGVRDVESTSRNEISVVKVEFEYAKIGVPLQDLRRAVDRAVVRRDDQVGALGQVVLDHRGDDVDLVSHHDGDH